MDVVTIIMTMATTPQTVGAGEFKAKCLELMDRVAESGEPIIITKRGKPVAVLTAVRDPSKADVQPDRVERSAFDSHQIDAGAQPVIPALCHQTVHDVRARASREEIPRFGFEEKGPDALRADLRISP